MSRHLLLSCARCGLLLPLLFPLSASAIDLDREPINYATTEPHNAVERLQKRLDNGQAKLTFEEGKGYLPSLLRELNVPLSSQMLVFSKTSLQRQRINPRTPRGVYFGDDVYVGYCQKGDLLEVTAVDPQLGAVFYSLDQKRSHADNIFQGCCNMLVKKEFAFLGTIQLDQSAEQRGVPWNANSGLYCITTCNKPRRRSSKNTFRSLHGSSLPLCSGLPCMTGLSTGPATRPIGIRPRCGRHACPRRRP